MKASKEITLTPHEWEVNSPKSPIEEFKIDGMSENTSMPDIRVFTIQSKTVFIVRIALLISFSGS